MSGVVIEDFKSVPKNTLRGFARAQFPSGMVLAEIGIHVGGDGNAWASPPSRTMLDRDGNAMRDPAGKLRWQPLITFTSGKIRNAWSGQVIDALLAQFPDALDAAS
jgi:hypothetical protein